MAYPSVTYTFTNGTTASATEVNQNFTDLINGLSDGTKDLSISALTVAGTASLNGAVNIGNATSDDIAVNGYITTALIPKTDDSYDLGTAALAWQDGYFEGKVYTDSIKALTSAGVTITDDGDVACVTCADGGAVTVGPAGATPEQSIGHTINGAFVGGGTGTSDGARAMSLYGNCRVASALAYRTETTLTGGAYRIAPRSSNGDQVHMWYGQTDGAATNADAVLIGGATEAGAWTLGASGFTGQHVINAGAVSTATAGSATLPAQPRGFLKVTINGNDVRIPYYNA